MIDHIIFVAVTSAVLIFIALAWGFARSKIGR